MAQRDVVLRWIEQIAPLVARMLGRGAPADLESAHHQVRDAIVELLGPVAPLVERLDARSAAEVIGDAERIFAWARLVDLDAAVLGALGRSDDAAEERVFATALAGIAIGRAAGERPDWIEWLDTRGNDAPRTVQATPYPEASDGRTT